MARDTFTYLHLPAVIGIVGMAVGLQVMVDEVAAQGAFVSAEDSRVGDADLYGGAALYLLSLSALRWRLQGEPSIPRLVFAAWLVFAGMLLSYAQAGPLANVAVVTATFLVLVAFDAVRYGRVTRTMRPGSPT